MKPYVHEQPIAWANPDISQTKPEDYCAMMPC